MVGHLIGKRVKYLLSIHICMCYKFSHRILSDSTFTFLWTDLLSQSQWSDADCKLLGMFFQTLLCVALCYCFMLVFGGNEVATVSLHHTYDERVLLHSFLRWITVVQVSCLFSTLNCSKKYSFWVCLHLLGSYSYVVLKMMFKMLHSESVRKWIADTKKHSLYHHPLGQHFLKCCNAVLWYEEGNVCKYWRYMYQVLAQL